MYETSSPKKKRPVWVIPLLVILLILSPLLLSALIWGSLALGFEVYTNSQPYPGKPTITHAEFPCTLVYELNGEEITLTDTIICEYDGIKYDDSSMSYRRQWTEDFRSGDNNFTLVEYDDGSRIVFHYKNVAKYLMGETDYSEYYLRLDSGVFRVASSGRWGGSIDEENLYNDYGIEIISFEYGPPIENTFAPATYQNDSCAPSEAAFAADETAN